MPLKATLARQQSEQEGDRRPSSLEILPVEAGQASTRGFRRGGSTLREASSSSQPTGPADPPPLRLPKPRRSHPLGIGIPPQAQWLGNAGGAGSPRDPTAASLPLTEQREQRAWLGTPGSVGRHALMIHPPPAGAAAVSLGSPYSIQYGGLVGPASASVDRLRPQAAGMLHPPAGKWPAGGVSCRPPDAQQHSIAGSVGTTRMSAASTRVSGLSRKRGSPQLVALSEESFLDDELRLMVWKVRGSRLRR